MFLLALNLRGYLPAARSLVCLVLMVLADISCKQSVRGTSGETPKMPQGAAPTATPAANALATSVPVSNPQTQEPVTKNANLTTYGVLKTPVSDYVNPIITGSQTSPWCFCRNIGTSPHIGWDLGFSGSNKSIAMANGIVKSKRLVSSACGYEVILQDTGGALWRYLHLNNPSDITEGQVLFQGAIVGTHAQYPKSGCGSGPHLHLERHSAGAFGDSEKKKSCDSGPETCHFDAKSPMDGKRVLRSTSEASALQAQNKKATEDAKQGKDNSLALRSSEGLSLVDPAVADGTGELVQLDATPLPCAFNQPEAIASAKVPDLGQSTATVQVEATAVARNGLPSLIEFTANAATPNGEANTKNHCEGPCIAGWTLFAHTPRGWLRVLDDEGTREIPVALTSEQKLCWPADHDGAWRAELRVDVQGNLEQAVIGGIVK